MLLNKETKELSIDKLKEEKKETNVNNNSFYNRNSKKKNTKWTQDWRGKSLGIFISSIILIGIAIPSGMAASGYFNKNLGLTTDVGDLISNNKFEEIKNDIEIAKNNAIIWQFDEMHKQGWFDDHYYNNFKKRVKKDSENSVQRKKDSLNEELGDTWKDEYKKFLSELGFHNEGEWINSMISEEYKNEEIKKFSNQAYIINTSTTDDDNWEQSKKAKYASKGKSNYNSSKEVVKYINNAGWNKGEVNEYSLTSEKFMDYFVKYYQPVLFNDSLIQFTPVSGGDSNESDISAGNINTNVDKIYNSIIFLQKLNEVDGFTPAAINYQGIQSAWDIRLEEPISNISLKMLLDTTNNDGKIKLNKSTQTTLDIKDIISSSLSSASLNIESSKEDVKKITDDDVDEYEKTMLTKIKKLIGESGEKNRKFNSSTEVSTKKIELNSDGTYSWKKENMEYATYISEDGLHVTGVQDSGKDLVINYLNYQNFNNLSIDSDFLFDNNLIEKFKSFVNNSYDNAVLLSWLSSPDGDISNIGESSEDELKISWITTISSYSRNKLIEKYNEAKEFFKNNENIYDYNEFLKMNFYSKMREDSNLYKETKKKWEDLLNNLSNEEKIIIWEKWKIFIERGAH